MIYKNFYYKYKMSELIIKTEVEKQQQDIEKPNSIPSILEEEVVKETTPVVNKNLEEIVDSEKVEELEIPEADIKEQPKEDILLKLGDIILISDPSNEILNNNVFFIEYIDPRKIKLINSETFEKTTLQISPDRIIG